MTDANRKSQGAGLQAAVDRGMASKALWLQSGEVVSSRVLSLRWGLMTAAVGAWARRGALTSVVIGRRRYYPSEFLELEPDAVRAVSRMLSPLSPESALVFWKRPHGALGGRTAAAFLRDTPGPVGLERVRRLAQAWAEESSRPQGVDDSERDS